MFTTARSYIAALRAGAAVGRASKLERDGMLPEAIQAARSGLCELRRPFVKRLSAPEGAALVSLTAIIERLTHGTNLGGAEVADLQDSLAFLKLLGPVETKSENDLRLWMPYFEAKLAQASSEPAPPNPSVELTCPGKPGHAAHVKR
jgi:hypothetical protein